MTDNRDTIASTPHWSERLASTFRITAEVSSLVLLIGFGVSVFLNGLVFAQWGVSFVMVATPADVVMSGLGFLFDILPVVGFFALCALAVRLLSSLPSSDSANAGTLLQKWAILLGVAVFGFVLSTVAMLAIRINFSDGVFIANQFIGAAIGAAYWCTLRFVRSRPALMLFLGIASLFSLVHGAAQLIEWRSSNGYFDRAALWRTLPDNSRSRVLWTGSEVMVLRRGSQETERYELLMVENGETLLLENDERTLP